MFDHENCDDLDELKGYIAELLDEAGYVDALQTEIVDLEVEVNDLRRLVEELEKRSLDTVVYDQKHRLMLGLDADLTLAEFLDRLEAI